MVKEQPPPFVLGHSFVGGQQKGAFIVLLSIG